MKISALRKKIGTQSEVASLLGVTISDLSMWEAGASVPRPYTIRKMARLYGVSIDELYSAFEESRTKRAKR